MGLIDDMDARTRQAAAARRTSIDYKRMNALWPKQKAALTRAVNKVNAVKPKNQHGWDNETTPEHKAAVEALAALCKKTVKEWDECGAWPDDWRRFERALEDALPWGAAVDLRYL